MRLVIDPYGRGHLVYCRQLGTTCKKVFMYGCNTRFGIVVRDHGRRGTLVLLTCGPLADTNVYQHGCAGDVGDGACVDSFLDAF